jgi:hypothetical protein
MSDYKEGFTDGYKFAREEIVEKLKEIDINDIDTWLLDRLADMIEGNQL